MERRPSTFDEWVILVAIGVIIVGGIAMMLVPARMLEIMLVLLAAGLVAAVFASWRLHQDLGPAVRTVESFHQRQLEVGIAIAFAVMFGAMIVITGLLG